jgi:hypothetical protein
MARLKLQAGLRRDPPLNLEPLSLVARDLVRSGVEADAKAPSVRDDQAVERHTLMGASSGFEFPVLLPEMLQSRVRRAPQHNIGLCRVCCP